MKGITVNFVSMIMALWLFLSLCLLEMHTDLLPMKGYAWDLLHNNQCDQSGNGWGYP
jgi:hypothetical protein